MTVKVSDHVDILTAQAPGPAILRVTGSPCLKGIFCRPFRPLGVSVGLLQSPEFQGDEFFRPCKYSICRVAVSWSVLWVS